MNHSVRIYFYFMKNNPSHASGDMFKQYGQDMLKKNAPLADRMRPRTLEEFIGQQHILGEGRLLRRAIQIDQLSSLIFYGPPGTGKTTLARIIANTTKAEFISINAVLAGVKDIRDAIDRAQELLSLYSKRTILFVDEVHRFNKAQQDALLPHVENGVLILIGATTENPYFEVNKALVSRSRIFQLQSLTAADLKDVALQALRDEARGFGKRGVVIDDDALDHLVQVANGDARGVLNALELAVETTTPRADGALYISRETIEDSIQKRAVLYDKDGDAHYDTISAFIKSLRGSDPDAALYWMAKMLYAGEDPRFMFRRMLILAGEDIGMADPKAIGVVVDAARAFDYVGLPEGRYHLAHACLYLATAPKSNSSMAFFDAIASVGAEQQDEVPNHLRDASRDKEGFGHGAGYLYPHAYRDHWVAQQYLPDALQGKIFYQPSGMGYEKEIKHKVVGMREARIEAMVENDDPSPLNFTEDATVKNRTQQQWMTRSLGSRGNELGRIREILLQCAHIAPEDLVLDLCTRTGLLAFEAARQVREGGVWALAHSRQSFVTTRQMAQQLELLSQPVVLETSWDHFDEHLRKEAGNGVVFNKIIGRSILTRIANRSELLKRIHSLLAPEGRIVLAEPVPSGGQRLSALIKPDSLTEQCSTVLARCEEELFGDPDDPMVNWDAASLEEEIQQLPGITVSISELDSSDMRVLRPADIDFWFREEGANSRRSLGERCRMMGGGEVVALIREQLHRQLDHKQVRWATKTLIITLGKMSAHKL